MNNSTTKKLRIGFLLQSEECPAWQHDILQRILKDTDLKICLIAYNGEKQQQKNIDRSPANIKPPLFSALIRPLRTFASLINPFAYGIPHLYQRLDAKYNHESKKLWQPRNIGSFPNALTTVFHPIRKGFCHYFLDKDIQTIKACKLDIIIRFGFSIIRGDIHHAAHHGVWSFHHGDNRFYRGGPPGVWELIKGKPEISVTLQQLSDVLDCGRTIARSTHRCAQYSVLNNKHAIYRSCGDLLLQKLKQTQSQGFESIKNTAIFNEKITESTILKSPRNFEFLPLLFNNIKHYIRLRWPRNKKIQWFLATRNADAKLNHFDNATFTIPPKDRFYADPFLVNQNGNQYVFFEELIYENKNAHISVGQLTDGKLSDIKPIIIEKFHMSYPFTFKEGEQWFMIPETRQDNSVRLYECTRFPDQWQLKSKLLENVELLDSTIHQQEGVYYLFANRYHAERNTSNECLVVYFADDLLGPWLPHPQNPLTINISNSRPAGKIFKAKNKLIMPTQNSAVRYGHGINFNEIEISKTHFSMKKVNSLSPSWLKHNLGSHTWNEDNGVVITDAHRHIDA